MVSRRTLFVISMMMAVLFFLFVFSGVVKDTLNDYDNNSYYEESVITKKDEWKADSDDKVSVVLIGSNKDGNLYNIANQWSTYTKRKFKAYTSVSDYKLPKNDMPDIILLNSEGINFDKDLEQIKSWTDAGMNIVFCNLPDSDVIANNNELAGLLGIQAVYLDSVEIEGVELFGGFLLGGDTIYKAENKEEAQQQDFNINIPWYQTTSGTKTYIVGLMDKDKVENEYMPGVLWRNSIEDAKIFAVNGDYMSTTSGIGLLSGIMNECCDYMIYPVVNSQNLSLVNFPSFAEENNDEMMKIYSRSQVAVFKDIVWPAVLSTVEKNLIKMTCIMSMQYDYEDLNEPLSSELVYYLKLMNEENAEAGLSTDGKGFSTIEEKLGRDRLYLVDQSNKYKFSVYYSKESDIKETVRLSGTVEAENMHTVTSDFSDGANLLSFADDDVTYIGATIDGFSHTYTEDMRVKGLETALGYSNILCDMSRVSWPENDTDRFEKLSEKFSKYTDTYWQSFKVFEQTTLSECDRRVRNFLALDYNSERKDETVNLTVENAKDTVWFILRTHDEQIEDISGGSYTEIEEDAYLIQADKSHVQIKLKDNANSNSFYYMDNEKTDNE